jgi:hypothetical protein
MQKGNEILERFIKAKLGTYEIATFWLHVYPEDIFPERKEYSFEAGKYIVEIRKNMQEILRIKKEGKEIKRLRKRWNKISGAPPA